MNALDLIALIFIPVMIIFAAAGRHPIAGIAASFAGVSGGFSANLVPGQLDALLFGITEAAVETVFGDYATNIAGNAFFILAITIRLNYVEIILGKLILKSKIFSIIQLCFVLNVFFKVIM